MYKYLIISYNFIQIYQIREVNKIYYIFKRRKLLVRDVFVLIDVSQLEQELKELKLKKRKLLLSGKNTDIVDIQIEDIESKIKVLVK